MDVEAEQQRLQAKLRARANKPGFKRNTELIRERLAELENRK